MSKLYAVQVLKKEVDVEVLGIKQSLPLSWADGMVGIIPVFDSLENAQIWADGSEIVAMEYSKNENA